MPKTKDPVLPDGWTRSDRDDGTFYATRWHDSGQYEASGATFEELVENAATIEKGL